MAFTMPPCNRPRQCECRAPAFGGPCPDADLLLQKTLALDPNNPFTLNNMGVTKEMEGDFPQALKAYIYTAGATVVTLDGAAGAANQSGGCQQ